MNLLLGEHVTRRYPTIAFAWFLVPTLEPYVSEAERRKLEMRISAGVRARFNLNSSWDAHPRAQSYIDFYNSMGLNGRKCSNPVKQAYRFLERDYSSKSPLIDQAMEIEYNTSISCQIYDFDAIGDTLLIDICPPIEEGPRQSDWRSGNKPGEMVTRTRAGELVHSPSSGNAERFALLPTSTRALLRLMKPPTLDGALMEDAIQQVWNALKPAAATYLGGPSFRGQLLYGLG